MTHPLYQEALMAHQRRKSGAGVVPREDMDAEAVNPACGDEVRIRLTGQNGAIHHLVWQMNGCAVAMASASLLSERLSGLSVESARHLVQDFLARVGRSGFDSSWGDFQLWNGIDKYPSRIRCVCLIGQAVEEALSKPDVLERLRMMDESSK